MRSRIVAALAACLLTVTAGVLAQSSGFPSRPNFQQVTVRSNTATISQYELDAPANEKAYVTESSGGIWVLGTATDAAPTTRVSNAITVDRTGTTVDTINLQATNVQVNGTPIATGLQGATVRKTVAQTGITNAGNLTAVSWDAEVFDTGNYHDNVTLNSRILLPTQTGRAQCTATFSMGVSTTTATTWHETRTYICRNGAGTCIGGGSPVVAKEVVQAFLSVSAGTFPPSPATSLTTPIMNVTGGDYVEAFVYFSGYSAATQSVTADSGNTASHAQMSCWAVK